MAKSRVAKMNEKIAEAVTGAFENIESNVTGGYKRIENGAVGGYRRIEDSFVDRFLTREGESVEEAKERLKRPERPRE